MSITDECQEWDLGRNADGYGIIGRRLAHRVVLTDSQVLEIRAVYAEGVLSQYDLAEEYGVQQGVIHKIVRRLRWRHI